MARPAFCIQAGGNGSRTSSKCAFAITARRSGFGMPFLFVLPSFASANIVSSSRSNWSAGRTSVTKTASVSPAFQNLCELPAGTITRLTGAGDDLLAVELEGDRARLDLEALGLVRVHVRRRDEAVRLDGALDENVLAAGLVRRLQEEQALAGDGVLDHISLADHVGALLVGSFRVVSVAQSAFAGDSGASACGTILRHPLRRTASVDRGEVEERLSHPPG